MLAAAFSSYFFPICLAIPRISFHYFFIVPRCILLRLFLLFQLMHTFTHFKNTNSHLYLQHLKHFKIFLKTFSYMFRSIYTRPSSGGSWAVLYAITKLNSVHVRSLCSCTVYGRVSLSSVAYVCLEFLSWWNLQDKKSRHTRTQPTIMTYGRILYKNITNVHPRNST